MKPSIKQITPFDARYDYTIEFTWSGNRAYGNTLRIYDVDSLDNPIYEETIHTYSLSHTIKGGSSGLENGKRYLMQVAVYDSQNIFSEWSTKNFFYVFSTPDFKFDNIVDEQTIANSSVVTTVSYTQLETEQIGSYQFYLYDSNNNLLQTSETMYSRTDIAYNYKGLENNTFYFIQCVGVTANGMPIDTGKIKIFIKYENASLYARFYVESDAKHGGNQWNTNIILIDYTGDKTFEYIDGDYINLENDSIYYDEVFVIPDNGSIFITGKGFYKNKNHIMSASNKNSAYQINLYSHIYDDSTLRFKLVVNNSIDNYILYSSPMIFTNDNNIEIRIRKNNNIYSIETYIEGVKVE